MHNATAIMTGSAEPAAQYPVYYELIDAIIRPIRGVT